MVLRDEVEAVRETADLFKVYRPEWLVVFTSVAHGDAGLAEARAYFSTKYAERVRDEDVDYVPSSVTSPLDWPWRLRLRVPNIRGEFKTKARAEAFIREQGWQDAVVVARNSRDEFRLKEYGVKKLPSGLPRSARRGTDA